MAVYNGPVRPGSRGGRGEFSWDNVKNDKDREYYLGHSVKALTGRWQKNKDVYWYTKAKGSDTQLQEEVKALKQREEELMQEALGLKPKSAPVQHQPIDQKELQAILKRNAQQAEEEGAAAPQGDDIAVKGLGFRTHRQGSGGGAALGHVLEHGGTLQGEGLPPPPPRPQQAAGLPQAKGNTAATTAQPGGAGAMLLQLLASGVTLTSQQLKELAKHDKAAAKKAKKGAKKARKEAKRAKKGKKDKKRSRDSDSSDSDGSEEEEHVDKRPRQETQQVPTQHREDAMDVRHERPRHHRSPSPPRRRDTRSPVRPRHSRSPPRRRDEQPERRYNGQGQDLGRHDHPSMQDRGDAGRQSRHGPDRQRWCSPERQQRDGPDRYRDGLDRYRDGPDRKGRHSPDRQGRFDQDCPGRHGTERRDRDGRSPHRHISRPQRDRSPRRQDSRSRSRSPNRRHRNEGHDQRSNIDTPTQRRQHDSP